MGRMRAGKIDFLTATDVAARGIDLENLEHVINFSFPDSPEVYIHRTGRTGRAGKSGTAISLIGPTEVGAFYYLKLLYKIKPEERNLPSETELRSKREGEQISLLRKRMGKTPGANWRSLAARLLSATDAEKMVASLIQQALEGSRPSPRNTAGESRPAKSEARIGRTSRDNRGERTGRRERRPERAERPERTDRSKTEIRTERAHDQHRNDPQERGERQGRGERARRPRGEERPAREEGTNRRRHPAREDGQTPAKSGRTRSPRTEMASPEKAPVTTAAQSPEAVSQRGVSASNDYANVWNDAPKTTSDSPQPDDARRRRTPRRSRTKAYACT